MFFFYLFWYYTNEIYKKKCLFWSKWKHTIFDISYVSNVYRSILKWMGKENGKNKCEKKKVMLALLSILNSQKNATFPSVGHSFFAFLLHQVFQLYFSRRLSIVVFLSSRLPVIVCNHNINLENSNQPVSSLFTLFHIDSIIRAIHKSRLNNWILSVVMQME